MIKGKHHKPGNEGHELFDEASKSLDGLGVVDEDSDKLTTQTCIINKNTTLIFEICKSVDKRVELFDEALKSQVFLGGVDEDSATFFGQIKTDIDIFDTYFNSLEEIKDRYTLCVQIAQKQEIQYCISESDMPPSVPSPIR